MAICQGTLRAHPDKSQLEQFLGIVFHLKALKERTNYVYEPLVYSKPDAQVRKLLPLPQNAPLLLLDNSSLQRRKP